MITDMRLSRANETSRLNVDDRNAKKSPNRKGIRKTVHGVGEYKYVVRDLAYNKTTNKSRRSEEREYEVSTYTYTCVYYADAKEGRGRWRMQGKGRGGGTENDQRST